MPESFVLLRVNWRPSRKSSNALTPSCDGRSRQSVLCRRWKKSIDTPIFSPYSGGTDDSARYMHGLGSVHSTSSPLLCDDA